MAHSIPTHCPACQNPLVVTELACPQCATRLQGAFEGSPLHRLNAEQIQFVEVFIRNRGNIREVERDLKISYPTVRSRLDQVIEAMGGSPPGKSAPNAPPSVAETLDALKRGDISFEQALQSVKGGHAST